MGRPRGSVRCRGAAAQRQRQATRPLCASDDEAALRLEDAPPRHVAQGRRLAVAVGVGRRGLVVRAPATRSEHEEGLLPEAAGPRRLRELVAVRAGAAGELRGDHGVLDLLRAHELLQPARAEVLHGRREVGRAEDAADDLVLARPRPRGREPQGVQRVLAAVHGHHVDHGQLGVHPAAWADEHHGAGRRESGQVGRGAQRRPLEARGGVALDARAAHHEDVRVGHGGKLHDALGDLHGLGRLLLVHRQQLFGAVLSSRHLLDLAAAAALSQNPEALGARKLGRQALLQCLELELLGGTIPPAVRHVVDQQLVALSGEDVDGRAQCQGAELAAVPRYQEAHRAHADRGTGISSETA
mmetsp:Transcript_55191/g.170925  ORF Transcript_55191/g.170925 Transcript_55191/m.170925 type:complete len:356 (+) Transcript_55191:112-1179(+)